MSLLSRKSGLCNYKAISILNCYLRCRNKQKSRILLYHKYQILYMM